MFIYNKLSTALLEVRFALAWLLMPESPASQYPSAGLYTCTIKYKGKYIKWRLTQKSTSQRWALNIPVLDSTLAQSNIRENILNEESHEKSSLAWLLMLIEYSYQHLCDYCPHNTRQFSIQYSIHNHQWGLLPLIFFCYFVFMYSSTWTHHWGSGSPQVIGGMEKG